MNNATAIVRIRQACSVQHYSLAELMGVLPYPQRRRKPSLIGGGFLLYRMLRRRPSVYYELWHTPTSNLIADFSSIEDALLGTLSEVASGTLVSELGMDECEPGGFRRVVFDGASLEQK